MRHRTLDRLGGARRRGCAALVFAAALAACQPLPRPFALPPSGADDPLRGPPDAGGVVVLPVDGLAPAAGGRLAELLSKGLRDRDIVAGTAGGNRESRFLQGGVAAPMGGNGAVAVTASFDLFAPAGARVASHAVTVRLPANAWRGGGEAGLAEIARAALPGLAAMIRPAAAGIERPPIRVLPPEGAPGDGAVALHLAMEDALRGAGLSVARGTSPGALTLDARVTAEPPEAGMRRVMIVWRVHGPDGAEIGRLHQANTVPAEAIAGPWGKLAAQVAGAAAGGLVTLLDRARTAAPH